MRKTWGRDTWLVVITGSILLAAILFISATSSSSSSEEVTTVVGTESENVEDKEKDNESAEFKDITNGLGNHIEWVTLEAGLTLAKELDKPLLLIIHKSWCGACRALKPKIRESKEMGDLSKDFVMVNTLDDEEPPEEVYRPDGGYIPRVLFFNPSGELLKEVINEEGNPQYKYYYYDVEGLISSMTKVIKMFQTPGDKTDPNENEETKTPLPTEEKTEL